MSIVHFPVGRLGGDAERRAFREGLAAPSGVRGLRLIRGEVRVTQYCAGCAAPIGWAPVWRSGEAYCSIECSLGGNRPA